MSVLRRYNVGIASVFLSAQGRVKAPRGGNDSEGLRTVDLLSERLVLHLPWSLLAGSAALASASLAEGAARR
jgi:hypothetical protein